MALSPSWIGAARVLSPEGSPMVLNSTVIECSVETSPSSSELASARVELLVSEGSLNEETILTQADSIPVESSDSNYTCLSNAPV